LSEGTASFAREEQGAWRKWLKDTSTQAFNLMHRLWIYQRAPYIEYGHGVERKKNSVDLSPDRRQSSGSMRREARGKSDVNIFRATLPQHHAINACKIRHNPLRFKGPSCTFCSNFHPSGHRHGQERFAWGGPLTAGSSLKLQGAYA
jgi:hypothetical protein